MSLATFSEREWSELNKRAQESPRRRANLNVHKEHQAEVQRLFIVTQPETYIRPHRHPEAHKWEFFTVLRGEIDLLLFDNTGAVTKVVKMSPNTVVSVELEPNTWHSYVCQEPNTLALEIKQGAYIPTAEKDFAPWAPAENTPDAPAYLEEMRAYTKG